MIGALYYIVYLFCGIVIAAILLNDYKRHHIIIIGLSIGTLLCAWGPAAVSLIFGRFDKFTNLIAFNVISISCIVAAVLTNKKTGFIKKVWQNTDEAEETSMILVSLPFMILITVLFWGHVLVLKDSAFYGGQTTYGDLSMHLGMVTSIARQGIFPPEYSILPGARLSYPFLTNSLSASLYLFGTPLRWSVILPSLAMSFVCFAGFFILAKKLSGNNKSAVFAVLLFFITGGLGFIYFLGDAQMFKEIFTGFYRTPTNIPEMNLRWVNVICDMMVPQRTTLMGWSVLIPCMLILYSGMKKKLEKASLHKNFFIANKELILAGVIAGLMPMVHTHSFLALGILCVGALIAGLFVRRINPNRYIGGFLAFLIPVLILAVPQLLFWIFTQSEGFVKKHLDWVNDGWPWLKFWVINIGLPFILIIPAFIWGRRKYLLPFVGATLIYIVAEIIVFQPNLYDNNKLLLVWYMIMCIIVGDFLRFLIDRIKFKAVKIAVATVLVVVLFTSGALTIIREVKSNGEYMLFSPEHIEAAKAIDEKAPKDTMILTGRQHLNAPAALSGRNIYAGSSTYLFFHGFNLNERHNKANSMYTDPENSAQILKEENIDYVYLSSYERYDFKYSGDLLEVYPLVFDNGEVKIYAVSDRAIELGSLK